MNAQQITKLARAAKRDGLTLTWCLIHLADLLESSATQSGSSHVSHGHDDHDDTTQQRLDEEALALVLLAVIKAYPAGADLPAESIPELN